MKKNLSALCFAGLVALTGLVATGCGSDDATFVNNVGSSTIREYAVIANGGNNSVTVKGVNLQNGTSSILNNSFTTGVGTNPLIVKTHPNINVVYVLNQGSNTISQFTMNGQGGLDFKGTVATPTNASLMVIHPSGGLVYVIGSAATTNSVGIIQRYTVNSSGLLTAVGATQATTNNYQGGVFLAAKDGDFSFGGGTFHVPCGNFIESFPVNADGTLGTSVASQLATAGDLARDVDVRPGQASLVAVARNGNDNLQSFAVANGVLSNRQVLTPPSNSNLGMGDFSSNGQYYVGSFDGVNRMFGYNVDNTTGTLTPLATNPMQVGTGTGTFFVNLDPSNNFILSTNGADNLLTARFRGQNGEFVGSTVDSQGLSTPQGFDYFNFNF
ncbi:hypothetical protein JST97_05080 [bacterium]|nr:hypothetical protein [bacterium]